MFAKKHYCLVLGFMMLIGLTGIGMANTSADRVWRQIDDTELSRRPAQRTRTPESYGTFQLDKTNLERILTSAPEEFTPRDADTILELPMPGGGFSRFSIVHSLIVEQGLVDKYPELGRTYSAQGLDDPTATARLDFLPNGFHAMILSPNGTVMIDPYAVGDTGNYVSYFKRDLARIDDWKCETGSKAFSDIYDLSKFEIPETSSDVTSGATLRTYRLALAANAEYCSAVTGGGANNTVANCLAAQVLIMNRVNGVYERDLTLRMVMVANNDLVVYAANNMTCPVGTGGSACTSANDPYSNTSNAINENTPNLNTVIGSANYDIGHVFSTGSGGVAQLSSPCGASKGAGTTGLPSPFGDPFAIDYVAHEMGHQWGSNHTFNASVGGCSGNRSGANAFEPGSGITIMGYAGLCGSNDLAPNSIDTMHVRSLVVIVAFSQVNNGNTCSAQTATGNVPPTVTLTTPGPYNIPKGTPFSLAATATDPNFDTLTYDWQQYNAGGVSGAATTVPNSDADGIPRPLFRNYVPQTNGIRYFPSLQFIRNNANVPPNTTGGSMTGELLPAITRTMNFQVVVRDNRANGGGINSAEVVVNVDGVSGPFNVTAPNTAVSWAGNSSQTITWNVAGTSAAPVNAANVKISFSSDGGLTFPITVLSSTPNDGTQTVTIPNIATTQGRIKVEGDGNIFFDMSDVNFTVTASAANNFRSPFDYDGDDKTDVSIFRPAAGEWWAQRSSNGTTLALPFGSAADKIVPADFTGDQKADLAFFRPATGAWFVLRSEDFSFFSFPFGTTGDTPLAYDFDGDGKADPTVFRPSTNTWFIQKSIGGTDIFGFGSAGDKPVVGDYDGDGKADVAIFRPAVGQWWIRRSIDAVVYALTFGNLTDKPVQGYYTADNKTDIAIWRPATGEWYILRSEDNSFYSAPFGASGDIPVPGDYDGDDRFDTAVFRPSTNTWFVQRTTAGTLIQVFGAAGDVPTPSAYVP
ncbi:MAG: hypothetical protein KA956_08365 [Pyrinomonadaceae bacterium]|nr:hypothetical protein [Pyrinomonadaceae bacterium]